MNELSDIILHQSDRWYYERGYLTIDLELFGKYLAAVFTKFLGEYYYFQKFTPTIRTDKDRPIWNQGEETKYLAIIGPTLYDKNSIHNYSNVRVVNRSCPRPHYLAPFTSYSKEYPSMFSFVEPLELDKKEFKLYFGDSYCEYVKISLGHIENKQFIPTNSFKTTPSMEINHSNLEYPFVDDYIRAIFAYKIFNKKPIIDESDMEIILEKFGINRKEKLQTIIGMLNSIKEEATEKLLENNNVGNALKLEKNNK